MRVEVSGAADLRTFSWNHIDHALIRLKLQSLSEEMRKKIDAEESTLRHDNRENLNASTLPYLLTQMRERRIDEWTGDVYAIYCQTWELQGHDKTPEFVQVVCDCAIKPFIRQQLASMSHQMELEAARTNYPPEHLKLKVKAFQLSVHRLEDRWARRLEIEAKELEHSSNNRERGTSKLENRAEVPKRRASRAKPPCFAQAIRLLRIPGNKDLGLRDFCRLMDSKAEQYPTSKKYKPPATWQVRTFHDKCLQRPNTVSRFLFEVRKHVTFALEDATPKLQERYR
jgi:hypothetical protein